MNPLKFIFAYSIRDFMLLFHQINVHFILKLLIAIFEGLLCFPAIKLIVEEHTADCCLCSSQITLMFATSIVIL